MHCVDRDRSSQVDIKRMASQGLWFAIAFGIVGCSMFQKQPSSEAKPGATPPTTTTAPTANAGGAKGSVKLPPPNTPRSWADARQQAARRLVAANPDMTYMSIPPDILLAIPVLSIELNGDGSIRQMSVMRYPSQARETVEMAMAAVRRAAPFGDVSKLPKPWKFNETFLFKDDKKFKPMTLDQR